MITSAGYNCSSSSTGHTPLKEYFAQLLKSSSNKSGTKNTRKRLVKSLTSTEAMERIEREIEVKRQKEEEKQERKWKREKRRKMEKIRERESK